MIGEGEMFFREKHFNGPMKSQIVVVPVVTLDLCLVAICHSILHLPPETPGHKIVQLPP